MGEILIGTRRPRSHGTLRTTAVLAGLVVIGGLVGFLIFRSVTSYPVPEGEAPSAALEAAAPGRLGYGEASLEHVGGIEVLRLRGGVHDLGSAHGRLQARAAVAVWRAFAESLQASLPTPSWLTRPFSAARMRWHFRGLDDAIPGHQLVEIAGLMRGVRASLGDAPELAAIVRAQAALDVGGAARSVGAQPVARSLSFVANSRSPRGDRLLIGRSFSLPGAADGGDAAAAATTLTFAHPADAIPFASVGWPGMVGVVTGINRDGIAVMVHPARSSDVSARAAGQPAPLIAREVLEHARSLDEAIAVLERATPLGAAAFVVVDGGARSWAVVERSPTRSAVRRQPSAPVVGDLLHDPAFADDPVNDRARRILPAAPRIERAVERLRQSEVVEAADAAAVLRDRLALGGGALPLGHPAAVDDLAAVHAAIIDASALVVWVSEGPGPHARFRAFDLRHALRGEGMHPAAPPDIAAEAGFDPAQAQSVRRARAALRRARAASSSRARRDDIARALALAPSLPEAHRVAGDAARDRGDRDAMRRHYHRYLELAPDDEATAARVRAILDGI